MKKIGLMVTAALVLAISAAVGIAYFSDMNSARNTFQFENPEITVTEEFPSAQDPNGYVVKQPKIVNTSEYPCYVRARVDFSSGLIEQECEIDYNYSFDIRDDGFWYWTEPLMPGEETEILFSGVQSGQNKDFEITVYAEAINIADSQNYEEAWGLI